MLQVDVQQHVLPAIYSLLFGLCVLFMTELNQIVALMTKNNSKHADVALKLSASSVRCRGQTLSGEV